MVIYVQKTILPVIYLPTTILQHATMTRYHAHTYCAGMLPRNAWTYP
jgi:hypothetical protein